MLLEGMFVPLSTPYLPDGQLNLAKLRDNVARYAKTPAAGLVALSQIGHPSLLSDEETRQMLSCVAASTVAEKVLIAGIGRDSVAGALDLIRFAAQTGYDAALVPMPSILKGKATSKELLGYFRALADRAELPIILDSGLVEDDIPVEVAADLAQHRGIIGIVDSGKVIGKTSLLRRKTADIRREVDVTIVFAAVTGRMLQKHRPIAQPLLPAVSLSAGGSAVSISQTTIPALKTRKKAVGFQVLSGFTGGVLEALQAGAVGAVPPFAASAPQACYEVLAAWKDGDPSLAAEKQQRIQAASLLVEEELGVAGIKYGCDLNGYFGGRPRLPMLPLSSAERNQVEAVMAEIRN